MMYIYKLCVGSIHSMDLFLCAAYTQCYVLFTTHSFDREDAVWNVNSVVTQPLLISGVCDGVYTVVCWRGGGGGLVCMLGGWVLVCMLEDVCLSVCWGMCAGGGGVLVYILGGGGVVCMLGGGCWSVYWEGMGWSVYWGGGGGVCILEDNNV